MNNTEFFPDQLTKINLDTYVARASLIDALSSVLNLFDGDLIDVGCGKMPYKAFILNNSKVKSYTGLDIENARIYDVVNKPDITWDGVCMPIKEESYDTAIATEVLEHCFYPDIILNETFRILKPGGLFFFTVPFLWNLHETPNDAYRYTPFALEIHLKHAGFKDISIKGLGGWHASMAQMLGLWIKRSPMSKRTRNILSKIVMPLMKILLKHEKNYNGDFKEGQMITGLWGIAKK